MEASERCFDECRMVFHKERQRAQRSALARLVTGEERETVPRKYTIAALGPCENGLLDVSNCERTEFVALPWRGVNALPHS